MENKVHFASVKDGSIVLFPFSVCYFMKVCTQRGEGAVVNLWTGKLLTKADLEVDGLGAYCNVVSDSLDHFITNDDEE